MTTLFHSAFAILSVQFTVMWSILASVVSDLGATSGDIIKNGYLQSVERRLPISPLGWGEKWTKKSLPQEEKLAGTIKNGKTIKVTHLEKQSGRN